jgi:hypothetical protein
MHIYYGWGARVGNLAHTSSAGVKHAAVVEDLQVYLFTGDLVEGFYPYEVAPGGVHCGEPWCSYSQMLGTSLTHQTGKNFGNAPRGKGRGPMTHDISNCGEWGTEGGSGCFQRHVNWLLWNHIQIAGLRPGDLLFSYRDAASGRVRKLRDADISRVVKMSLRVLGLNDRFFSSRSMRIAMLSIMCQLGEDEVKRIGNWSSKAWEFYKRMIGNVPCAGDLQGVPADFVRRVLPFGPQREFERSMRDENELRRSFEEMLQHPESSLQFTRAFHQDCARDLPPGVPEQLYVESMIQEGVFDHETFAMGQRTVGRVVVDTDEESGASDHEHADVTALFAELSSAVEDHDGAHAMGSAFHDQ